MPIRSLLAVLLLALAAGCSASSPISAAAEGDAIVRTGSSFGMCVGYCQSEMAVHPAEVVITHTSREPGRYPTRVDRLALSRAEADEVAGLVAASGFASLQPTYGCPDCADGGAEWIEVEGTGGRKRVVYEVGHTLPEIAALQAKLRALRARLPETPRP